MSKKIKKVIVTRRSKGEKTKTQILNAAIEVLAQQGIKGTTHRAVALKAKLQLSLTTYYFTDIQALVQAAFQLNCSQILARVDNAWQQAFDLIESYDETSLKLQSTKEKLHKILTELATRYLFDKIKEQPLALAVQQLLYTTIQISPELRELADQHREALLTPFIHWCNYFNKATARIDADIMLTMFTQLEYRNLPLNPEDIDIQALNALVSRIIGNVMAVKT